eukprot:3441926-Pyramimonas_sp.AAC.1
MPEGFVHPVTIPPCTHPVLMKVKSGHLDQEGADPAGRRMRLLRTARAQKSACHSAAKPSPTRRSTQHLRQ